MFSTPNPTSTIAVFVLCLLLKCLVTFVHSNSGGTPSDYPMGYGYPYGYGNQPAAAALPYSPFSSSSATSLPSSVMPPYPSGSNPYHSSYYYPSYPQYQQQRPPPPFASNTLPTNSGFAAGGGSPYNRPPYGGGAYGGPYAGAYGNNAYGSNNNNNGYGTYGVRNQFGQPIPSPYVGSQFGAGGGGRPAPFLPGGQPVYPQGQSAGTSPDHSYYKYSPYGVYHGNYAANGH
uniref:Uncharacterized protein n=1 Tax=Globodera rostochiensis TaxID=31243 RepID=A0A914H4X7_GLORO